MKFKLKIKDFNGKLETKEIVLRDIDHFEAQRKYPSKSIKNKKIYSRKEKYKKNFRDEI